MLFTFNLTDIYFLALTIVFPYSQSNRTSDNTYTSQNSRFKKVKLKLVV